MTETLPCVDFPDVHPVQRMYAAGLTSVFRKRATKVVSCCRRTKCALAMPRTYSSRDQAYLC